MTAALRTAGVSLHLDIEATEARRDSSGTVHLALSEGQLVAADEVLVATGRTPNTKDLGLDHLGLIPGDWLAVDDTLAVLDYNGTPVDDGWLYAAGDVNKRALLTHHGKYQARALGDAIAARAHGERPDLGAWGRHAVTADERAITQVIFTEPEVAAVGLSAEAASAAGIAVTVVDHDLGAVAGAALHADGYRGRARMVIDADRNIVIGFTAVGPDVAELLHAATIAITRRGPAASPLARGPRLPDPQRDLAPPPRSRRTRPLEHRRPNAHQEPDPERASCPIPCTPPSPARPGTAVGLRSGRRPSSVEHQTRTRDGCRCWGA